jgi:hypothetical protein
MNTSRVTKGMTAQGSRSAIPTLRCGVCGVSTKIACSTCGQSICREHSELRQIDGWLKEFCSGCAPVKSPPRFARLSHQADDTAAASPLPTQQSQGDPTAYRQDELLAMCVEIVHSVYGPLIVEAASDQVVRIAHTLAQRIGTSLQAQEAREVTIQHGQQERIDQLEAENVTLRAQLAAVAEALGRPKP